MQLVDTQEVINHYLKSELARIFEASHDSSFWEEFDRTLSIFLTNRSPRELERLLAALCSLYRENAGLYRKVLDKQEPSTGLPPGLPQTQLENFKWYRVEMPVDELKIPNLPPVIMPIIREVDRDLHRFIRWVDMHPNDERVRDFKADVAKPMVYREIIAIFKPRDLPEDARGVDFWILDGVHRMVSLARKTNRLPVYLGIPERHKQEWESRWGRLTKKKAEGDKH